MYPVSSSTYSVEEKYTHYDVPQGYNGPDGDPIVFRFANVIEVAKALLNRKFLHHDDPAHFCFEAETVIKNGSRVYTRDINSGRWWPRTQATVPSGMYVCVGALTTVLFIITTAVLLYVCVPLSTVNSLLCLVCLFTGTTLLVFIFSSDKTTVTGSGSQCAHPVYVTLGNFRCEGRRGVCL